MAKGSGSTRSSAPARSGVGAAPSGGIVAVSGDNQIKAFLLSYTPAESGFTSADEIKLVSGKLGLEKMNNDELREMRNKAVSIYSNAMDKEIKYDENGDYAGRTDKYWDYSEGMMSVTAVIDEVRRRKGTPISML